VLRTRSLTALAVAVGLLAAGAATASPTVSSVVPSIVPSDLPAQVPAAATRAEPALPTPKGWPFPEAFPRTSGTGRLQGGASFWSDFVYDDRGAASPLGAGQQSVARLANYDGTFTYPTGPASNNGADVFRNAVALDAQASYWRVDWNTLVDPTVPLAVWALDTNASTQDGVRNWPAGVGVRSPGLDKALVVSSRGAWLVDARSGDRTDLSRGLTVDTRARSFIVRVPRSTLRVAGTWRIRLAAGLANAEGDGMARPSGASPGVTAAAYNVSYRTVEQEPQQFKHGVAPNQTGTTAARRAADLGNYWMEDHQAEALLEGDVSEFAHDLRWSELAARRATPEPLVRGYSNRWYVSALDLGQGIVNNDAGATTDLKPNFLGRVQPYAVYVPSSYREGEPMPLTWMLHSLSVMHNQYGALDPQQVQQTCEDRRSICATTLGRGPDMWYFDEAEVDFWEVWNRIAQAYDLDPERTVLSGYSMGGFGTYKLALAYPHLFAKGLSFAGPPTCGIHVRGGVRTPATAGRCTTEGDTTLLVGNAQHIPFVIASGVLDELVPFTSIQEQVDAFDRRGYRYHAEYYAAEGHIGYAAKDAFAPATRQLGRTTREQIAARIDYTWLPNLARPELGIGSTGAYWLGDPVARDKAPGALARMQARSAALADPEVTVHQSERADVPGDPSPALVIDQTWQRTGFAARSNALTLTLSNVSSLVVDARRAGLAAASTVAVEMTSDGATAVRFTGLKPGATLAVKGAPSVRADRSGVATVRTAG